MAAMIGRLQAAEGPNATPGLFVNPAWVPGTPGTFAIIAGVSEYPFLEGGASRVAGTEVYGLPQLHVSAATAHRFFMWLAERYEFAGAPPAMCWLLLSPVQAELENVPGLNRLTQTGAAPATLANIQTAVESWYATMDGLPGPAAQQSRAVFFFSGHGLEVHTERQILLASDYLGSPVPDPNKALSTEFLRRGLAPLPVAHQFFFVDACRNDVQALRGNEIEGLRMLPIRPAADSNPDQVAPVLYATTSGTQTWQPREVQQGFSLFGGALIEGLEGAGGMALNCDDSTCSIDVYPLQTFVKTRVAERLLEFRSSEQARTRLGGVIDNLPITVVDAGSVVRGDGLEGTSAPTLEDTLAERYDVLLENLDWEAGTSPPQPAHEIFGSEQMERLWAGTLEVSGPDGPARRGVYLRSVERSDDSRTQRLTVDLPGGTPGHWLAFDDGSARYGFLLPDDGTSPQYDIEIDLEYDRQPPGLDGDRDGPSFSRWISKVEAGLSASNLGMLQTVADAWSVYEAENIGAAAKRIDYDLMEEALQGKMTAPLAAAVGGLFLVKARRWDDLHDVWLRNLSDGFTFLPDGAVLWAEQLAATTPGSESEQATHLLRLRERGAPVLSETFTMADTRLRELTGDDAPDFPLKPDLVVLAEDLKPALRHYRPGGLFTMYSGPIAEVTPDLRRV